MGQRRGRIALSIHHLRNSLHLFFLVTRIDLEYQDAAGATQTLRYTIGGTVPGGDGRCLRIGDDRTIFAVTAESAAAVLALGDLAA